MALSNMHILVLSSWYPNRLQPFLGNFVRQQAETLAQNFKVSVVYTVADPKVKNIEINIEERNNLREIIIYHAKGKNLIARKREQDRAFEKALTIIEKPDIIHGHCLLSKGYLFVIAKKRFNCPLIVTEHGSYFRDERRNLLSLKERFILRITQHNIDQLIAVSEILKKDMLKYFNRNIEVIPNIVDTENFKPIIRNKNDITEFLHVSTLDRSIKNPTGIIEAVDLLCMKGFNNFHMTIVSDENYQDLSLLVEQKKLNPFITFRGPLEPKDLVPCFQKSDAFVLFSSYESFSIVVAEAWSCGVPVISTPVGVAQNMPEYLGIEVSANDSLSLAMGMEKIINGSTFDPTRIRQFSLQFSKENVLAQLTAVYEKFLG